jgi:hypothetical protein
MRSSRFLVLTVALILGAAMSTVPLEVAGAQAPSTAVLVPSNGATVSGTSVVLDAGASAGVTQVQFELTGGSLTDSVIATATATYYGWIAEWNSTTVADGTYTLQSVATEGTSSTTSTGISITVSNGVPSVSIVLPSNGATLTGSQWLDATASPGVTSVEFEAVTGTPGACPERLPGAQWLCTIGFATPTEYGWLIDWDTTQVPNAYYDLMAGASYPNGNLGIAGISPVVSVSVVNPGPTVVVPANNSTVSGSQWLDCTIPSQLTGPVQFGYLSGGFPQVLGTATASEYGWLYDWNTASVANGTYSLYCSATYPNSSTGLGPTISVTVAN